jgi:hypothetical protein
MAYELAELKERRREQARERPRPETGSWVHAQIHDQTAWPIFGFGFFGTASFPER